MVALLVAPTVGQNFTAASGRFSVEEFDERITPYSSGRSPHQSYAAHSIAEPDTTGVENIAPSN